MERKIAVIISKIFNPLFIVFFFLMITFNLQFYFATSIPENARWMILGLVAITTFILPGMLSNILSAMLKRKGILAGKDERLIPLAVTAIFYLFTYHLLDRINFSPIFNLFILGMASLAVVSIFIVMIKNVSLYMLAAGALAGGFIGLHLTLGVNLSFFILCALLLGGIIGFSRLSLEKHQPQDIYIGYIIGVAVMMLHYLYL